MFIIDLLSLNGCQQLDHILQQSFSSVKTLVLGFSISGDLSKLFTSYPWMYAFRDVKNVLDLQQLARIYFKATSLPVRSLTVSNLSIRGLTDVLDMVPHPDGNLLVCHIGYGKGDAPCHYQRLTKSFSLSVCRSCAAYFQFMC